MKSAFSNNHIICINAFVKLDDTFRLLEALNTCIGASQYELLISVDSTNNMPYTERDHWIEQNRELKVRLLDYSHSNNHCFKSIEIVAFGTNHHPYRSCKKIIDIGMQRSDYIIFLEDDCIVSSDYLLYHEYMCDHYAKKDANMSAILASYCNAHAAQDDNPANINKVKQSQWITSYEMGICRQVWEKYGGYRGMPPEGDIYFAQECKNAGLFSLYPLIPRCYRHVFQKDAYSAYYVPSSARETSVPVLSNNKDFIEYEIFS
jgi:hypothetical protein